MSEQQAAPQVNQQEQANKDQVLMNNSQNNKQKEQQQQSQHSPKSNQLNNSGNKENMENPLQHQEQQENDNNASQQSRSPKSEKVENVERLFDSQSQKSAKNNYNQQQQMKNTQYSTKSNNNMDYNHLGYDIHNSSTGVHEFYQKRKDRKQADKDGEILANRIALLKQEEIRTLKKIEETRKKALEVYYLKLKNDDRQKKRKEMKGYKDKYNKIYGQKKKSQPQRNARSQERAFEEEERLSYTKEQWLDVKKQNAQRMKEQKRQNELKIISNKTNALQQARDRKNHIQSLKEVGKMRRYEYGEQKKEIIRREIEEKARLQEEVRNEKLGEIKRMEDYEIELIQRLKSTQQMQQNAYEELENALMLNAEDFSSKYLESNAQQKQEQSQQLQQDNVKENDNESQSNNNNQEQQSLNKSSSQPDIQNNNQQVEQQEQVEQQQQQQEQIKTEAEKI